MVDLYIQIAEAQNTREVDRIVERNIDRLPNPFNRIFFCRFANNAKKRIIRIKREAKKKWHLQLN